MVFSIIIIGIVGVVAYYHYTQGFFSAGISAILAVLAAIFAIAWQEKLVTLVSGGRFSDQATAITLVGIFVLAYSLCRYIFDKLVPGNLRFPLLVEKIGAGVTGAIAGIAVGGIVAIAAQSLPFTESIFWWERFDVAFDKPTTIKRPDSYQLLDAKFDQLNSEKFLNNEANGLLLPVDSWMLSLVNLVSAENGSLSNGRPFEAFHPDYLRELFGQRVALQAAARHTGMAGKVAVTGIYTAPQFDLKDQERYETSPGNAVGTRSKVADPAIAPLPPNRRPKAGRMFIVVRTILDRDIADVKNGIISFTPAGVRLCVPTAGDPLGEHTDYFPVGTLQTPTVMFVNEPDDLLFADPGKPIDLVFDVPRTEVSVSGKGDRIADGSFLEFKRLSDVDLASRDILPISKIPTNEPTGMIRKSGVVPKTDVTTSTGPQNPAPVAPTANVPLSFEGQVTVGGKFGITLNVNSGSSDEKDGLQAWGTYSIQSRQFTDLDVTPSQTIQLMARGQNPIDTLSSPPNTRIVVAWARPREDIPDRWGWADKVGQFALVDTNGKRYQPNGVFVKLKNANGQDMLSARYSMRKSPIDYAPDQDARQMRPTDVGMAFVIPDNVKIVNLQFNSDVARNIDLGN